MGQPGLLPIQIVNQGRQSVVLGVMTVSSRSGTIENGQSTVGALEVGGYFPLDVIFTPEQAGRNEITVTVNYIDDFNQLRSLRQTLTVEVLEAALDVEPMPDGGGEPFPSPAEETFWQKLWRFLLGLLGLDSSPRRSTPQVETPLPAPVP